VENIKIEYIPIKDLKPYERNARKHADYDVSQIMVSIQKYGFNDPIGIWSDKNIVVEGHGRLLACKKLKMQEVPCIRLDHLTDEQRKAYAIIHNKSAELSEWDIDLLAEDVPQLDFDGFDIEWDLPELAPEGGQNVEEVKIPEEVETRAKLGDLWQLGEHRLICGDSTDSAVIDRLMDGVKAKLLLTDPPYGIKADKGVGGFGSSPKTANKYDDEWDSFTPSKDTFDMILKKADDSIIFGGNYFTDKLPLGKCWIVWDKVGDIQFQNPYSDCELAWTNLERNSVKKYTKIQQGFVADEKEKRVHPTQKPVGMLADILKDFSEENDSILDCFGGSGSTLIACEQLNRKCYMCELDPHYCDVIIQRWEKLTGQKAVLIEDK